MTLPRGTDRLESPRLVLRRMRPDDLPFYTRIHALPEVARYLWPEGRPRSPEQTKTWLEGTIARYEELALGYLAVMRKDDGVLIGRCGLMEMVVETAVRPKRRDVFGTTPATRDGALRPAGGAGWPEPHTRGRQR